MSFLIQTYQLHELPDFINSEEFSKFKNLPISKHRAISYFNNPRADKNDKVLYVAYENNDVIGYRLILPDHINVANQIEKVGWYSCIWIDPKKRGLGIAKQLVEISLKDWGQNILFQGPVIESKTLYNSTNLFNEKTITGIRAYARFDFTTIIPNKIPSLAFTQPLLKLKDTGLNYLIPRAKKFNVNYDHVKRVSHIDDELEAFILNKQSHNLFKRNKSDFNWILDFPWILQQAKNEASSKYYFSSVADEFENICLKFYQTDNQLDGFVFLQLRDKHLSVQSAYFNEASISNIIGFIYNLILTKKVNYFSCFDQQLINYINQNPSPFIFKKTLKRAFFYSKNLAHYFKKNPQLRFEAGDGDMIFT